MNKEQSKEPYSFREVLPIIIAFDQSLRLCDQALDDSRLQALNPNVALILEDLQKNLRDLIVTVADDAPFR